MSGKHVHRPPQTHGEYEHEDGRVCVECGRTIRWVPDTANRRAYWTPSVSRPTAKSRGSR